MNRRLQGTLIALSALSVVALGGSLAYADSFVTSSVVTANLSTTNNQTDAISTTTANVAQVKASRTLTVNSLPVASTTSLIGSCTVTYSTNTADSLNCAGNAAIINVTTHNSSATLAATLGSLLNLSGPLHGSLTATSSGVTATFATAGTETSTSTITFTDGTSGAVSSTASTSGVVAAAEVLKVTVGGTVEPNDIFSVTLPTGGAVAYTSQVSDASLQSIANNLATSIQATSSYAGQSFTVSTTTNALNFTAKVAGTGFNLVTQTTNATPIAQSVAFTPASFVGTVQLTIGINANSYSASNTTIAGLVGGLATAMAADPAVSCSANATALTCTAITPGTAFTYSAAGVQTDPGSRAGGSSGGGGGGGGGNWSAPVPTPVTTSASSTTTTTTSTTSTVPGATSGAASITANLKLGSNGPMVRTLQMLLASDASLGYMGGVTGHFGLQTKAAVKAFQKKHGLPRNGMVGPRTRAALIAAFGE